MVGGFICLCPCLPNSTGLYCSYLQGVVTTGHRHLTCRGHFCHRQTVMEQQYYYQKHKVIALLTDQNSSGTLGEQKKKLKLKNTSAQARVM